MINVTVIDKVDDVKILGQINNETFWYHMAREWYRLLQKYTPRDTGNLMTNVVISPNKIKYNAPYAAAVYNRVGANFKKSNLNPYATAEWNEAAKTTEMPKLLNFANTYIKQKL